MRKKYAVFSLLIIITIAVFFRFWEIKITPPGFYPDEAMYANNALEAWENKNWKIFYPENNGREGLWINIISLPLAIFGNETWVTRSVSAIFGILTVLGLYFLTKELLKSERVALFASFFLATSFWHINFSRIGFRAILAPFFLVWSFYFLWRVIIQPRLSLKNPKAKPWFFVAMVLASLAGIMFGLGFHTYIAYRAAPLLLVIPFVSLWRAGQKKMILIFLIFAFLAALPLGIYFLQSPQDFFGRTSQISVFSAASPIKELGVNIVKTIGMFFWVGDYNWRHNLSGTPQLWWPTAILFALSLMLYCKNYFQRLSKNNFCNEKTFLFIWLIAMLIPTIVSSEGIPHALRAIVIIPPVIIFTALGLEWIIVKISDWLRIKMEQCPQYLGQLRRIQKELAVLLFLFFIANIGNAFNQYFLRWAPSPYVADAFSEGYVELGNYLETPSNDAPKYVIVNVDGVDVYGIPMPAQTTMFITKTYLPEWQKEKNIFYTTLSQINSLVQKTSQKEHFYIATLENDPHLRLRLKEKIPGLKTIINKEAVILYK